MDKHHTIEHLARLLHLEVHVVSTYDAALERLGTGAHPGERGTLERLRGEHEGHVVDITELLREAGEPAPPYSPDVESVVAPARDALRAAESAEDVLQGVRIIERVMAQTYSEARDWGVGVQVHDVLTALDIDEQRHVSDVEALLGDVAGTRRGR